MTAPNFLPSRTQEELQQDVRDIGKALDRWNKMRQSIPVFAKAIRQLCRAFTEMCRSPEFQKVMADAAAGEQA